MVTGLNFHPEKGENRKDTVRDGYNAIRQMRTFTIIFFLAVIIFATIYGFSANKGSVTVQIGEEAAGILGADQNPIFLFYSDITSVEMINNLDTGTLIDGTEMENTQSGTYQNELFGEYRLNSYRNITEYIVISCGDAIYVFNQKTEKATEKIYQEISQAVG
ncbi:MAG: hypothetical protein LUG99_13520 [Lachnospiraceae bacterium]|nr:hypothetical protein [Lachnospiraceae bacterium]